jgi:hypothetical protein
MSGLRNKPAATPPREAASLTGDGGSEAICVARVPNLVGKPSKVSCQNATMDTVKSLIVAFLVCCPREVAGCKQKRQGQSHQTHGLRLSHELGVDRLRNLARLSRGS